MIFQWIGRVLSMAVFLGALAVCTYLFINSITILT